jgi:hypothetical protein
MWVWGKEGKIFFSGEGKKTTRKEYGGTAACAEIILPWPSTILPFSPFANSTWTTGSKHTSASYQLPVPIPLPLPFVPCAALLLHLGKTVLSKSTVTTNSSQLLSIPPSPVLIFLPSHVGKEIGSTVLQMRPGKELRVRKYFILFLAHSQ